MGAEIDKDRTLQKFAASMVCAFILNALCSADVLAAPEEVQVYLDEFAEAGKAGLDLHTNYVRSGQQPTNHQFRVTPELSYGINTHWEVAAYWLTVKDPGGSPQTDGMKLRAKWRPKAPSAGSPFYWAVNFEAGQLSRRFYPDGTSGEIKLIGVWKTDPWTLGVNFNLDRSLRRKPSQGATTEIDAKIAYQIREGLQVGVESYSYRGEMHNATGLPESSQANYLAVDFNADKWDFNVGVGRTSGQSSDKTVLKATIGVPL